MNATCAARSLHAGTHSTGRMILRLRKNLAELNRHRHDSQGSCPRRNEVDLPALIARGRSLQSSPGNAISSYLPSPQPEMYAGFQPAEASHGQYNARGQQRTQAGSLDGAFPHFPSRGYGA